MLLHVDFETRSRVSLKTHGSWAYSLHPSTDIWCMCYRADGDPADPYVWTPDQPVPEVFKRPFRVVAHNYRFEQAIWANIAMRWYEFPLMPTEWFCTMAMAYRYDMPGALDKLAPRLGIDEEKDAAGKALMTRMHNRKTYDPEKEGSTAWKNHDANFRHLIAYCQQDVRVEERVFNYFRNAGMDWEEFKIDQRINDRGIKVDVKSAAKISKAAHAEAAKANQEITRLTGGLVKTGRQTAVLLEWLQSQGYPGDDVRAETVAMCIDSPGGMTDVGFQVLKLRKRTALGSLAKFDVMTRAADPRTDRMHGLFQLYGASHTGRWGGRLVQPQNLPRMKLYKERDIELAIGLFCAGDVDSIAMLFGDPMQVAKDLIRPMFTSDVGLIISDLAQIECRTLAWLSGCLQLMELFQDADRDPYSEVASEIYGKTAAECGKGTRERHVGKATVLGCGYGMGPDTFASTLAKDRIHLEPMVAKHIVHTYRSTFPQIPQFWRNTEKMFRSVLAYAHPEVPPHDLGYLRFDGLTYSGRRDVVITLPSGRTLHYNDCKLVGDNLTYVTEKSFRNTTYGGKLVENITQAVARDVLMHAMRRLDAEGLPVVGHVHDEVIVESGSELDVQKVDHIMSCNPPWATGLPLAAETALAKRYTK